MDLIAKLRNGRLANFGNGYDGEFFCKVADELERLTAEVGKHRNETQVAYRAGEERIADLLEQLEEMQKQWVYWRGKAGSYARALEYREATILKLKAEAVRP